ncbi:MAG: KTSC domain-containing protein [Agriterribacter sp.]
MPSSVVSGMHYNEGTKVLRVIFVSGAVYDYKNVPVKIYREMKAASSKGTFLNTRIKEHYPFEKVK